MKRAWIATAALLLASCGENAETMMQGYGEADYIYIASQEAGVIGEMFVREGDTVEAGAPVFRLDPDRLTYSVESATAQSSAMTQAVRTAQAEATLAERNFARGAELFERGFYPRARLDADRAARDAANARLAQVRRELSAVGAETGLARERLNDAQGQAPIAGTIERIFHRQGEVIAAGAPVAALLSPENMKVRFFAPEAMLSQLSVGGQVNLSCDNCPDGLTGRIIRIATEPQFTPPVIFSLEQREKLVYLVEARPDQPGRIRPGAPVDVRLP